MPAASRLYNRMVFGHPLLVIFLLCCLTAGMAWYAQYFKLDASADSLLMEGDEELEYSRQINNRYGTRDSVTVAYTPQGELFSQDVFGRIAQMREEILALERVESVDSLLNVPIFGDTALLSLSENYDTLLTPGIDLAAAKQELMNSPVFGDAIVSADGETTALLVSFARDERYVSLLDTRETLRRLRDSDGLSAEQATQLAEVTDEFDAYSALTAQQRHDDISEIRGILARYQNDATVYLGGAPMIADDMVTFVQNDLTTFSLGVFAFIVFALGLIFRRLRWIFLPLACCAVAGIIVVGILGLMDWRVTVVSSNFMSLLL
ncbi:MAG: MMPL family transporter, partial [Pseudomonadales bacterium]|nr:MMPL family transporter [Pseudomonadales bacterium]